MAGLLLGFMIGLLLFASYVDVTSLRIPNEVCLAAAMLFVAFALAAGVSPHEFLMHLLAGFTVLILGFLLFTAGVRIGGGDAKLLAALSLWLGFVGLPPFLLLMSLTGGALAIAILTLRRFGVPAWLTAHGWRLPALELEDKKSYVPYAPAMALAFIYLQLVPAMQ